MTHQKINFSR